ncbi:hypothetical protein BD410DRAFT_896906 [Rickenella mellea]|uniref:MYND-type domain-containing protein n=1 Tax=Rickenella mellea TaxID=50990 RepID=A0A4Y7Q9C6_9AGAM|nr:hypothetical protein BD410DRAFT_896906 [Rickenella mellea]
MSGTANTDVAGPTPPQLPKKFLSELVKHPSMVGVPTGFSDVEFNEARRKLLLRYCSPDQLFPVELTGVHQTFLQIALKPGYVALVCEMIRLGTRIDALDSIGQTALFRAVKEFCKLQHDMEVPSSYAATEYYNSSVIPKLAMRLKEIARLLVEHHADVNFSFDGLTCLQMLCRERTKDWELIGILITYGAHDDRTGRNAFNLSTAEEKLIDELYRRRQSRRPPRQCPCLSGRLAPDCHKIGPKPYPSNFLCPCRSTLVYGKCCKRRMVFWREVWNEERGILEPWRVEKPVHIPLPKDTFHIVSKIIGATNRQSPPIEELNRLDDIPSVMTQTGIPIELQDKADWAAHLEDLSRMKLVDPAFAFAMRRVKWNIRPMGRKLPKNFAEFCARSYNENVDEYIATRRDGRGKLDIEIAAKLGPSCGALYRVCEADGCSKQEGRNVAKLKMCQKCKMTVYCSVQCQKAHWKVHKPICGDPFQTEQPLPSQSVLYESMSETVVEICSELLQRLKDGDPERYRGLFPEGVPEEFEKEDMNIALD